MLMKKSMTDYRKLMTIGQSCLFVGVLGSRVVRFIVGEILLAHSSFSDFFMGFMDGITVVLLCVSIVFNVKGFMLYKECRAEASKQRTARSRL